MAGDTEIVFDGHIVRLEILQGKWEVVRHGNAVAILVLSEAGEMLLVKQFRRAVGDFTLEVPAGLIDAGETPQEAARRELQEEAGLDGEVELLSRFYSSPGFCDEELFVYRASNLRASVLPRDEDEADMQVLWMPPAALLAQIGDGSIKSSAPTVVAAMCAGRA